MLCSLCNGTTSIFQSSQDREYVHCINCKAILLSKDCYLSKSEEKQRYQLHHNDIHDPGYLQFTQPISESILQDFPESASGLDFGCGTGPVITSELKENGYSTELYDPYFAPKKGKLKKKYDFIICCEVMEHFHNPREEFQLLHSLLKPGGKIYCKTEIWNEAIDFQNWYYKNDATHVFFYHKKSLHWIKKHLNFDDLKIKEELIVFGK